VFEAVVARLERRGRHDLYHSALEVQVPHGRFVIEQAPVWRQHEERGVVAEGGPSTSLESPPALPIRDPMLA
jgi:hypothetical protein